MVREIGCLTQQPVEIVDLLWRIEAVRLRGPAVAADTPAIHPRWCARSGDIDQQDGTLVLAAETIRLRRAGVVDALADGERPVPVAEREIIEPREFRAARIDQVLRLSLATAEALDRAVGEADADQAGLRLGPVHPAREVSRLTRALQRRRQDHGVANAMRLRFEMEHHVSGQSLRAGPVPEALRPVRVMVARQHVPAQGHMLAHPLQRFAERTLRGRLMLVEVARDEDVGGALGCGQRRDGADHVEPGLLQHRLLVLEAPEDLADLPVGRVDETHRPVRNRGRRWTGARPKATAGRRDPRTGTGGAPQRLSEGPVRGGDLSP